MYKEEREYTEKYGHLPNDNKELLEYIQSTKKIDMNKVDKEIARINNIEWKEIAIRDIPIIPIGSPRPRINSVTKTFYVKGAKKMKKILRKYIDCNEIICTRVEYLLEVFQPTPKAMTNTELYLCELGLIRPISKPDFDNVAKTFTDPLESVLLLNDNLINPGRVEKYYSIKPRVNIFIKYQADFDCNYNRNKIEKSVMLKANNEMK